MKAWVRVPKKAGISEDEFLPDFGSFSFTRYVAMSYENDFICLILAEKDELERFFASENVTQLSEDEVRALGIDPTRWMVAV